MTNVHRIQHLTNLTQCDERISNSIFDKFNIELTSLFYHIEC